MRRALLVIAVLSAAHGCDCGTKKSSKPAQGSAAPVRDRPPNAHSVPKPPARDVHGIPPKGEVRNTAPITLEEAQAAMPALDGARQMGATAVAPNGAQARTSYCVDADNIAVAGEGVLVQLRNAGWERVTSRPPAEGVEPKQFTIVGEQGTLRVTASVTALRRTGCDATVKQFFTVIAIQKIGDAPAPPGPSSPTSP